MIDLQRPIRTERRRGFQPPWYTVYIYKCPKCGNEVTVRANSFRGRNPEPGIGAIVCPHPQCASLQIQRLILTGRSLATLKREYAEATETFVFNNVCLTLAEAANVIREAEHRFSLIGGEACGPVVVEIEERNEEWQKPKK